MIQLSKATLDILHRGFIEEYWQKQSLFFSQCFTDNQAFEENIDMNELAGLALEEGIESRLISQADEAQLIFSLEDGPFSETQISSLPQSHWTLLIQAVDHYFEHFQQLKQQFNFIPQWRLDDVMVSISPTGGTVGPHFDQYDVFLIQACGTREWQVGQRCDEATALTQGNALSIIKNFSPEQSYQCQVGDMLYIPPGTSHWGTATSDNCVTISIGFRAPSYPEIIDDLCLEVNSGLNASQRFKDSSANLQAGGHPALISTGCLEDVEQALRELLLNKRRVAERFNAIISQVKYTDDFEEISAKDAQALFNDWHSEQADIVLRGNSRINFSQVSSDSERIMIGLNGQVIPMSSCQLLLTLIQQLCEYTPIKLDTYASNTLCRQLLIQAIAQDAIQRLDY